MSFFSGSGGKTKSYGDYLQSKRVSSSGSGAPDIISSVMAQGPRGHTGIMGPTGPVAEFMDGGDTHGGHLQWDSSFGSWVVGGVDSVHLGVNAGLVGQGTGAVAVGIGAGSENQGAYAVAIGHAAGSSNQKDKSIVINASGAPLNPDKAGGFFVKPVTATMNNGLRSVVYDTGSGEIRYHTNKTFVLPYPGDEERYLVHACLEGPEAGVYYRGSGIVCACGYVEIVLPVYAESLADDFTIQITSIHGIRRGWWWNWLFSSAVLECSRVVDGRFRVYGVGGKEFFWLVHGRRGVIDVAPLKKEVAVQGFGPYTWTL